MNKGMKRILALAILCFGFVWLKDNVAAEGYGTILTVDEKAAAGECGANGAELNWTIYEQGDKYVLVISGTGAMEDYTSQGEAPWYGYSDSISGKNIELILGEGVTRIGNYAFCPNEKQIDTTTMYSMQFYGSLTIPSTVESIGDYAFAYNRFSENLIIPDIVTEIGKGAFRSSQLYSMFDNGTIVVGSGVKTAGTDVFSGWYGTTVTSTLYNLSNVTFALDSRYPWPKSGTVYTITRHYNDAIGSSTSRKVLPNGVEAELTEYHSFPNELDKVGDVEFDWYRDDGFTQSIASISPVTSDIDVYGKRKGQTGTEYGIPVVNGTGSCGAGENGNTLKWTVYDSFDADELGDTLVISGAGAMADYASVTDTPWYSWASSLRCLVLEEGVTHLGNNAFYGTGDTGFSFEGKLSLPSTVVTIGEYCFVDNQFSGKLEIPNLVKTIGQSAFQRNKFTEDLILPIGLEMIGQNAFQGGNYYNENQFSYVVVPKSVTIIGDSAFPSGNYKYYNFSEQTFKCYYWNSVDIIPTDGFLSIHRHYDDGAETVTTRKVLPDGVAASDKYPEYREYHSFPNDLDKEFAGIDITWYADAEHHTCINKVTSFSEDIHFYGDSGEHAGEFYATETVTGGECGAQGRNLRWALEADSNSKYTLSIVGNGDMMDYTGSDTPWNGYKSLIQEVVLGSGITRIGNYAFYGMSGLSKCKFPDTIKSIGKSAFVGTSYTLRNRLVLPEGIESVEDDAFYYDGNVGDTVLILPESLKEIGERAFYWASTNAHILIGSNATFVDNSSPRNSMPFCYNRACNVSYYNFSSVDLGIEPGGYFNNGYSGYYENVALHTITRICGNKTTTRMLLPSDKLPVASYPETDYPELVKYRTFPSELDRVNGKELIWYTDENKKTQIGTSLNVTGDITVYADCPGHEDSDGDGYCDFCGESAKLTITGAVAKEISFVGEYTVPDCMYLVDGDGNRVTTVTGSQSLTAVFAIVSANPSIAEGIAMNYKVRVRASETETPSITFNFSDKTYTPHAKEIGSTDSYKEYQFTLQEVLPQQMCESISATVSLGDKTVSKTGYSVKAYCESVLSKDAATLGISDDKFGKLQTLVVDMLYYGDEAQKYGGQEATTTSGLTEEQKAKRSSDSTGLANSVKAVTGNDKSAEYQWKSAKLQLQDRITVILTFTATDVSGLKVKASLAGGEEKVYDSFRNVDNDQYCIVIEGIPANQYDSSLTAAFYKNDTQVGKTVTYSVASYVSNMKNKAEVKDIVRAIYDYGTAAKAYQSAE